MSWDGKTWPPPRDTNMPAVLTRIWDRLNELEARQPSSVTDVQEPWHGKATTS